MNLNYKQYIYKVISKEHWQNCQQSDEILPMEIDIKDGYLHFSTLAQLKETLRLYFANRSDLILLALRAIDVKQQLKWEKSRNNELFPHIYGTIDIGLIQFSEPIAVSKNGTATLPEFIKC